MKLMLPLVFLLSSFLIPTLAQAPGASQIVGIQSLRRNAVVAFTRDSVFRTSNNGEDWIELPTGKAAAAKIVEIAFDDSDTGWILLSNNRESALEIRKTIDGGNTWAVIAVGIDPKDLTETNLENSRLSFPSSAEMRLTIELQTSSNFSGKAVYSSIDGGSNWTFVERNVGLNTHKDVSSDIVSGKWTLRTEGTCYGDKTGCIQETRVFISGKDVTPPVVKQFAEVERSNALSEAGKNPLFALPPGGNTRISLQRGFDKCQAGSVAQMQIWWNTSPMYDTNIYFSGRNRACAAQPVNTAWVDQVTAMGWGLIPTVVGYQSPCTSSTTTAKLSYDVATAETQGRGEADIAVADAVAIGLTTGSVIYYDMERYDPPSPDTLGCRAATVAFLKGWTDRIKELGYKSGVYGSPKNAQEDWVGLPTPSKMDAIWMARWDNVPSVWTYVSFPSFPTNEWTNHQRIKQWQAPHNETWGGVTFNIDGNNSDAPVAGLAIARNKNADFDGDGKADISVFRPDSAAWYFISSANSSTSGGAFGAVGDIPAPGDYDGDGKTDFAVFRPADGSWHMLTKAGVYRTRVFGASGDIPVAADYNGDGKTDNAVFRPSDSTWYISNSDSLGTYTYTQFGQAGDKPSPGDYDGDGKADLAVFRPNGGTGTEWWISKSNGGVFATQFGVPTDKAAPMDYTGDGKADIAFWRPSTGDWYVLRSEDLSYFAFPFGIDGDVPASGDFDGDGKADTAVFRPSNGVWYLLRSQAGFTAVQFGLASDRPVENAYLPQ